PHASCSPHARRPMAMDPVSRTALVTFSESPMFPQISVLMPVYNTAPFLREAVNSILSQTFHNFEFIIINDGSSDHSLAVLQPLPGHDPDIRHMMLTLDNAIWFPTSMMRRQPALDAGGFRHPFLIAEDYDLLLRLMDYGQLANLPDRLLFYRQHFSSTVNSR